MASQLKLLCYKRYIKYKWDTYNRIKRNKLVDLVKLFIENDRVNEAIQMKNDEDELTNIIEKRAPELRQFYTDRDHKSTKKLNLD